MRLINVIHSFVKMVIFQVDLYHNIYYSSFITCFFYPWGVISYLFKIMAEPGSLILKHLLLNQMPERKELLL